MTRRRWLLGLAGLALLLGLLALPLLATGTGTRVVLERIEAEFPGLTVGHADGRLSGTVVLDDVHWQGDGIEVSIRRLALVPRLRLLLGGTIAFASIDAEGLRVRSFARAAAADAPGGDVAWPRIPATELTLRDAQWTDGASVVTITRARARAALDQPRLVLERLDLSAPEGRVRGALSLDLVNSLAEGRATFDWLLDEQRFQGVYEGQRRANEALFTLTLQAPWQATVAATTDARQAWNAWQGTLDLPPQSLAGLPAVLADAPTSLHLEASAQADGPIEVAGTVAALGREWLLDEAVVTRNLGDWRIDSLRLRESAGAGELRLAGMLHPAAPLALDLQATLKSLSLPWPAAVADMRLDGTLHVAGNDRQFAFAPALDLSVPGLPRGRLGGRVTLDAGMIELQPLLLEVGGGSFTAAGQVPRDDAVEGAVAVVAQAFDPALLAPAWSGRLDGAIAFRGSGLGAGTPTGTLQVQTLQGQLRQRAVNADGAMALSAGAPGAATLRVRSGRARLELDGDAGAATDFNLQLDAPDLADLFPGWRGALTIDADLARDPAAWPRRARIDGSGIAVGDFRAATLRGVLEAAAGREGPLEFELVAAGLDVAGQNLDRARMQVSGPLAQHRIALELARDAASVKALAEGTWNGERWDGRIAALDAVLAKGEPLALQAPALLAIGADRVTLGALCVAGARARLCADAEGTPALGNATLRLDSLPLQVVELFVDLPDRTSLDGEANGVARLAWSDGAPLAIDASLRAERGRWIDERSEGLDVGFDGLALDAAWRGDAGSATVDAMLLPAGSIHATVTRDPADPERPWRIVANADLPEIKWIEEFFPQFDATAGHAWVELDWRGGAAPAQLRARGRIEDVAGEMPGLGIRLADGNLRLEQDGDQVAIQGSVDSNGGTLKLVGRYDPREEQRLLLELGGIDVEVANLPEARLRVTPDLRLSFDGDSWRLGGKIVIPKARIDVSRLESGARRSADVVVIDDPPGTGAAQRPWRVKVEVVLGGDVVVQGFGFDGNVIGLLTVSQRSGRQATGSGELVVDGRYSALGQNFDIESGRLLFSGGALDNPSLSLRATQRFGNNTTTVRINGTAANPELHVGTPDGVTEVDALAALMGSSGTFAFGRYLTPRLYVGYGIGLISGGEVFSVRYRINRSFDIEGTSGAENRAALNYRIER